MQRHRVTHLPTLAAVALLQCAYVNTRALRGTPNLVSHVRDASNTFKELVSVKQKGNGILRVLFRKA